MTRFRRFITARRLSLSLILVMAGMMYVSTLIPQEMASTPERIEAWRRGHQRLVWLVDHLGLDTIFGQPWFAATMLFAVLALAVSCRDQLVAAWKKLRSTNGNREEIALSVPERVLRSVACSNRFFCLRMASSEHLKFVRHPWGYFGNALLHAGIVTVVCASFFIAVTGKRGALILVEGEQRGSFQSWNSEEHGILASTLGFPGSIRLDRVRVRFDTGGRPSEVSSDITITEGSGRAESLTASVNGTSRYRGLRVYHASLYGDAFTVEFSDAGGSSHLEKMPIQQPVSLSDAGYEDFALKWSPYLLSTKYYADVDRKSMTSTKPLLVLRLLDREHEIARVSLTPGSAGMLGGYRVRLVGVEKWAKLIFVDITGMSVVFTGFALIILGALMNYATPPRELVAVRQKNGGYRVSWHAVSFREFFLEERDGLAAALRERGGDEIVAPGGEGSERAAAAVLQKDP